MTHEVNREKNIMLKVQDVAARLNCSTATVYQLIESQQLPHYRCPGIRVSEEQLAEFLAARQSAEKPRQQASKPPRQRLKHIRL